MKKILMTLVIIAMAAGTQAQTTCVPPAKHKAVVKRTTTTTAVTTKTTDNTVCKMVPKNVCKISEDRRSVTCYQTLDIKTMEPYGTKRTVYGSTGPVPGGKIKFSVPTTVIKGDNPDYCYYDAVKKESVCYRPAVGIYRDQDGYYHYGAAYSDIAKRKAQRAKGGVAAQ